VSGSENAPGRWMVGFAVAAGLHAAAGVALTAMRVESAPPPPGVVMIDMAAEPVAPPPAPPPPAPEPAPAAEPAPPQEQAALPEPEPEPPPEPEPMKEPEAALPEPVQPPPPKKVEKAAEKPKPPKPRPAAAPPPVATQTTAMTQAPVAASSAPSETVRTWQSTLLAHLERHKRYPRPAQARREQGVAYVRFAMDRQGRVLFARLERGCGYEALDQETIDMVLRAQPLPPPPPGDARNVIELVAPVRYALR
jgi:periplasmic protein TonB